jgi:hypothetical protein
MALRDFTGSDTIALASVTFLLALAAVYSGVMTYRALGAAANDTRETRKARTDEQAPRVVVAAIAGAASCFWPPDAAPEAVRSGEPVAAGEELGLCGWLHVVNDGRSSGVFRTENSVTRFPEDHVITNIEAVGSRRPRDTTRFVLGPGEGCILFAWAGLSTEERREQLTQPKGRPDVIVQIRVDDTFEEGIRDTTWVHFLGAPVHLEGLDVVGGGEQPGTITVDRTRRIYNRLFATDLDPTYDELTTAIPTG